MKKKTNFKLSTDTQHNRRFQRTLSANSQVSFYRMQQNVFSSKFTLFGF